MTELTTDRIILTCTCEDTMPIDGNALSKAGCGGAAAGRQLCRSQTAIVEKALSSGRPVMVACTQEAPLFGDMAEGLGQSGNLSVVNIRETAGWSSQAKASGPKMAALIAAASVEPAPFNVVSLESAGVALILGADDTAVDAARKLAETLDVTVLVLPGASITPPRETAFPVMQGKVRNAQGHLGAFELTVDSFAAPAPSSRTGLAFGDARNGAVSRADLVIDLTGGQPLFPADDLRPGYFRADPASPGAVADLVRRAAQMVGTFDKPQFISFSPDLCAHSRNRITGCTRCLDLCPTGAITPAGDSVAIDAAVCAGCGACASVCPTGAASYALPAVETMALKLRAALAAWHAAGGKTAPTILFHDLDHGTPLIDASARFGRGLPAAMIPFGVNEVTQIGPEIVAAAFAYGAGRVIILTRARPKHDVTAISRAFELVETVCAATGHQPPLVITTDDPDALENILYGLAPVPLAAKPSRFLPPSDKRGLLVLAFAEMNRSAPSPAKTIALPAGAPFGTIEVDTAACTLCHACTGACPAGALSDNPDRPMLRFTESACVQCGICAATCPEGAITLAPRIDFAAWDQPKRVLNEEEPFCCTGCGKPFGTKSGIERVQAKLASHWMFAGADGEKRLRVLTMCEDCRVEAVVNEGFDPHGEGTRIVRTTADYLKPKS